jgi:HK97 family phage portal protein
VSLIDSIRTFIKSKDMNERTLTPAQVWGRGGIWQPLTGAGVSVTVESAMQAATGACIRLLADDISSLPVDVYRKVDGVTQESNKPAWLEYPTGRRWDTFQSYISDVVVSMLSDGNAFIECVPNTFSPRFFKVHDPESITIELRGGAIIYKSGSDEWDETQMAHIPWIRLPGKLRGMSVLDASREATGLEIAARQWAGAFFRNGGTLGSVIEHPGKPTQDEVELMRESFNERHEGSQNAWRLGVVTGGAKLAYGGRVMPREADLEPLWKQVLEQAARLYHIPPHLLGSQDPGGSSYSSVEHRAIEYVEHAMMPVTTRIEAAHDRFLGRDRFLKVNTNALLRGDVKSRAAWYQMALTNKVIRPSEVRDKEDLPFDPENTGYLQTPNNNAPDDYVGDEPKAEDDPKAASITINDVELRDEAAAKLTERVTEAIVIGQERTTGDIAQMHIDLLSRAEQDVAATRDEMQALQARFEAELEAEREARKLPLVRRVFRDEEGRIVGTVDRQGESMTRKVIERDEAGRVVTIREVAA